MTIERLFQFNGYSTIARRTDPPTSHAGAAHIAPSLGAIQQMVLHAVEQCPNSTASELDLDHGWRSNANKRIPELHRLGMIEPSGTRACKVTGAMARTWRAK